MHLSAIIWSRNPTSNIHTPVGQAIYDDLLSRTQGRDHFIETVTEAVEHSLRYVLDGEKSFDLLEACEKSVFGVKFEKRFVKLFGLPRKTKKAQTRLDTVIAGFDVDVKTTLGGRTWMIPPEAFGHWCLVLRINVVHSCYDLGLAHINEQSITKGVNRDCKNSLNAYGISQIDWLISTARYELNPNSLTKYRTVCLKNLLILPTSITGETSTIPFRSKTTPISLTGLLMKPSAGAARLSYSVETGLITA